MPSSGELVLVQGMGVKKKKHTPHCSPLRKPDVIAPQTRKVELLIIV